MNRATPLNRATRARRGYMYIELLFAMIIMTYALHMVYQYFCTLATGEMDNADAAQSVANNRMAIDTMCDHVRNAVNNASTSTGVANSCLSAASATSFTYYTSSNGANTVTYTISGGNLTRSINGGTAVTEAYGLTSLSFSYYKAATYETPWQPCATPSAPTTAELPNVCGIQINAVSTYNGVSTQMTTTVRLRNAPVKSSPSGL